MAGPTAGTPLPSSADAPPDPLDLTTGLRLKADLDNPLRTGFLGYDDTGALVLRGHRDGEGFRAILMNFVIESALGVPYYRIRQPSSGFHVNPPFQLLDPNGATVGLLRFAWNQASLEVPGQAPLTASIPAMNWKGYTVDQGSVHLATITFVGHPFSVAGADVELRFEPLGSPSPKRRWVVALVAWSTLYAPPWGRMTTR